MTIYPFSIPTFCVALVLLSIPYIECAQVCFYCSASETCSGSRMCQSLPDNECVLVKNPCNGNNFALVTFTPSVVDGTTQYKMSYYGKPNCAGDPMDHTVASCGSCLDWGSIECSASSLDGCTSCPECCTGDANYQPMSIDSWVGATSDTSGHWNNFMICPLYSHTLSITMQESSDYSVLTNWQMSCSGGVTFGPNYPSTSGNWDNSLLVVDGFNGIGIYYQNGLGISNLKLMGSSPSTSTGYSSSNFNGSPSTTTCSAGHLVVGMQAMFSAQGIVNLKVMCRPATLSLATAAPITSGSQHTQHQWLLLLATVPTAFALL